MNMESGKLSKWLAGGLIFSLAVNLFLGGFLVTHMMRPDPFSIFPKLPLHQLIKDLPKADRDKAKAIIEAQHPVLHQEFEAMKAAQGRLQIAIKADPINRDELNAAFDNLRDARSKLEHNLQIGFVEIIAMLPAKDRENLAMRWYRPPHKGDHHFWKHAPEDGAPPPATPAPVSPPPAPQN